MSTNILQPPGHRLAGCALICPLLFLPHRKTAFPSTFGSRVQPRDSVPANGKWAEGRGKCPCRVPYSLPFLKHA